MPHPLSQLFGLVVMLMLIGAPEFIRLAVLRPLLRINSGRRPELVGECKAGITKDDESSKSFGLEPRPG
jgi:hypothetical protein